MLEYLRDPAWQVLIGAGLTVLGSIVALWIYWLQRQIKELAYGLVSAHRLISVADGLSSRVKVEYDGVVVSNLHLLVFGLKNSGHKPVSAADFERPLRVSFTGGKLISVEVISEVPTNLGSVVRGLEEGFELQPLLLNSGDQILVQALVSASTPNSNVDVRIVDVPRLEAINTSSPPLPMFTSSLDFMIGGLLVTAAVSYFGQVGSSDLPKFTFGMAVCFLLFELVMRFLAALAPKSRRRISDA